MRTLAKRYWKSEGIESRHWKSQDFFNYSRLIGMAPQFRSSMIRALVDTAPSPERREMIGTQLWEDFFSEDPSSATMPFRLAKLSARELEACLLGVALDAWGISRLGISAPTSRGRDRATHLR